MIALEANLGQSGSRMSGKDVDEPLVVDEVVPEEDEKLRRRLARHFTCQHWVLVYCETDITREDLSA